MTNTPRLRRINRLRRTEQVVTAIYCVIAFVALLAATNYPLPAFSLAMLALGLAVASFSLTWKRHRLMEQDMPSPMLGVVLPKEDGR